MTIHYQNRKGEEEMISGIIHLQNLDNEIFIASTESGKELRLRVSGIEGIYCEDTKTVNITKREAPHDAE